MAAWIKGITVYLAVRTQTGTDAFNAPVYAEQEVPVDNVLITPLSDTEILDTINLTGKRAVYELSIPKGDAHDWTDTTVRFFGEKWRTIGHGRQFIDELTPLDWNRKVQVESIVGQAEV
ncbi:MAG: hypothetical protein J6S60_09945 [Oscillospiraceae bacterium]|nr:hypothetical protein [Oscillospiraceae bacterium]